MKDFRDLRVRQKAHEMALRVYRAPGKFPKEELHGLTGQMRGGAVSITANIAEGCGKRSKAELQRYWNISTGSTSELEYHRLLAQDLHLLAPADYEPRCRLKGCWHLRVRRVEQERLAS